MPKKHEAPYIRGGLADLAYKYMAELKPLTDINNERANKGYTDNEQIRGLGQMMMLLNAMLDFSGMDVEIFGEDGTRQPTREERRRYAEKYAELNARLRNIAGLADTLDGLKDEGRPGEPTIMPELKKACRTLASQVSPKLRQEAAPNLYVEANEQKWELTEQQQREADILVAQAKKNAAEKGPDYSAPEYIRSLPQEIRLSGNVKDLAAHYVLNKKKMRPAAKEWLLCRMQNLSYLQSLQEREQKRTIPRRALYGVKNTGKDSCALTGYQKLEYQTQNSGNGCWSCAYAMLLKSRGIELDQKLIRAYRPKDIHPYQMKDTAVNEVRGLLLDKPFSVAELATLSSELLPQTAMQTVGAVGIETDGQRENIYPVMQSRILHALRDMHSPVALQSGGHFVTVMGIEGDTLTILDSLDSGERIERKESLWNLLDGTVSLTWLNDLEFDKQGRCTNVPEAFADRVAYYGGHLTEPSDGGNVMNVGEGGFEVTKTAGDIFSGENAIGYNETLYTPIKIPGLVRKGPEPEEKRSEKKPVPQPKEQPGRQSVQPPKVQPTPKKQPVPQPMPKKQPMPQPMPKPQPKEPQKEQPGRQSVQPPKVQPMPKKQPVPQPTVTPKTSVPQPQQKKTAENSGIIAAKGKSASAKDFMKEITRLNGRLAYNSSAKKAMEKMRNGLKGFVKNFDAENGSLDGVRKGLANVLKDAKAYQKEKSGLDTFSKTQVHRLKSINYLYGVNELLNNKPPISPDSAEGQKFLLAVKLVNMELLPIPSMLCSDRVVMEQARQLYNSSKFRAFTEGKTPEKLTELRCKKGVRMLKDFSDYKEPEPVSAGRKLTGNVRPPEKDMV